MLAVLVDLVGDLGCPWCYLGFRRLRRLQHERPLQLSWRPFLLNPHLPPEGIERQIYRSRKFGSPEAARRLDRRLTALGEQEGIAFDFDSMARTSWTVAAHALLLDAQRRGDVEDLLERLFAAYFVGGRDLADASLLEGLAHTAGLRWRWPGGASPPPNLHAVLGAHQQACDAGITGVPLFLFGGRFSIAGAQPLEALRGVADLAQVAGRQAQAPTAQSTTQGRQAS